MKKIILALCTLAAVNASAGLIDQSLAELDNNPRLNVEWPVIEGVEVKHLCTTGDAFQTIGPVAYCAESKRVYKGSKGESDFEDICVDARYEVKVVPGGYYKEVCTQWGVGNRAERECLQSKKGAYVPYKTNYRVDVYRKVSGPEQDDVLLGTKDFTVPACL